MACFRTARRPIGFLLKGLNNYKQCRHDYSTWVFRGDQASKIKIHNLFSAGYSMFARRFSVKLSASDQMNLVQQLRKRTSAPIIDVKASLVNCNWDIEAAQKELRKRGLIIASKKSSRTAAEGLLAVAQDEKRAVVIELNCETDFVAKLQIFQHLALSLARSVLSAESFSQHASAATPLGFEDLESMKIALDHTKLNGETTVQNAITEVAAMVGENVKFGRGFALSTSQGIVSSYLHTSPQPGLGRMAGILTLEVEDGNAPVDALQRVGSSIAMHVVASRPLFLSKELVSSEAIESERDILRTQAESTGKPPMAIEKMVEGRLRKYFEEVVLLEQKFVMNDSTNIKTVLNDLSKEVGSSVKIGKFLRMEVGEVTQRAEATIEPEAVAQ